MERAWCCAISACKRRCSKLPAVESCAAASPCERADVAVITNMRADHFGEYGIESAEDLAETKLAVAHTVGQGGTLVLNADDATLMGCGEALGALQRGPAGTLRIR